MTDIFTEALRDAISAVVRQHLPDATSAGRLSGLALTFEWVDVGPAAREHVILLDCDPARAVDRFGRARRPPPPPRRPSHQYRRRTDPPAPPRQSPDW